MGKPTNTETLILVIGDIACFFVGLWLALVTREQGGIDGSIFIAHATAFSPIFLTWLLIFFTFDLYGAQVRLLRDRLFQVLTRVGIASTIIAIGFFYFIAELGITPKLILFLDLIATFILIFAWRSWFSRQTWLRSKRAIFFACSGDAVETLALELMKNPAYGVTVLAALPADQISSDVTVVVNPYDESIAQFYDWLTAGVSFVTVQDLFEAVFLRVPLSLINERWCLENISNHPKPLYDLGKRFMDVMIALPLLLISLIFYPLVWILLQFDEGRGLFSFQDRVGEHGKIIAIAKFRTMIIANDNAQWEGSVNRVVRFGPFLRKSRLDELPQLWNVLKGDISLIGPRPEFPDPVASYTDAIPFYPLRHLIKPGLSGWAQMYHDAHPHHGLDIIETGHKLSYDLYYIKNRSLGLDLAIALKTVKMLLSIAGK